MNATINIEELGDSITTAIHNAYINGTDHRDAYNAKEREMAELLGEESEAIFAVFEHFENTYQEHWWHCESCLKGSQK